MTRIMIELQYARVMNYQKFVRLHRETQSVNLPLLPSMPTDKKNIDLASKHLIFF